MPACLSKAWSCRTCVSSSCWWGETPAGEAACAPARELFVGDWSILLSPENKSMCPSDNKEDEKDDGLTSLGITGILLITTVVVGVFMWLVWIQRNRVVPLALRALRMFGMERGTVPPSSSPASTNITSDSPASTPCPTAPIVTPSHPTPHPPIHPQSNPSPHSPTLPPQRPMIEVPLEDEDLVDPPQQTVNHPIPIEKKPYSAPVLLQKMKGLMDRAFLSAGEIKEREKVELSSFLHTTPVQTTSHGGRYGTLPVRNLFADSDDDDVLFVSPDINTGMPFIDAEEGTGSEEKEKAEQKENVEEKNEEQKEEVVVPKKGKKRRPDTAPPVPPRRSERLQKNDPRD